MIIPTFPSLLTRSKTIHLLLHVADKIQNFDNYTILVVGRSSANRILPLKKMNKDDEKRKIIGLCFVTDILIFLQKTKKSLHQTSFFGRCLKIREKML